MFPNIKLKDGNSIPRLGFGTWQLQGSTCQESVEMALETGYRHIDTADVYGNHIEVGNAIKHSDLKRKDFYLTSKLWFTDFEKASAMDACKRVLDELQVEYLDLYLMHWPNKNVLIETTFDALEEMRGKGLIKSFGVSNFTIHHIEDTLKVNQNFVTNQVEFHPSLNQEELKSSCEENGIVITAYSPIAQGQDLELNLVKELSNKYERSTSQVVLNWLLSKGIIAIPRSSNKEHIEDNFKSLEWRLEETDVKGLDKLNTNNRLINPDFNEFNY